MLSGCGLLVLLARVSRLWCCNGGDGGLLVVSCHDYGLLVVSCL